MPNHVLKLRLGFIAVLLLLSTTYSLAAPARRELVFLTLEYPPYSSENLPAQGAAVEILQFIFAGTAWTPKVRFVPWSRVSRELSFGRADGALMLWPEEVKRYNILSTSPIFISRLGFYVRSEDAGRVNTDLSALKGQRVCTVRSYGYPQTLYASGVIFDEAISDEVNLKRMSIRRCDFVAVEQAVGEHILNKQGNEKLRSKVSWVEPAFAELPLTFGITPGKEDSELLLATIEKRLAQLQTDPDFKKIFHKYQLEMPH